MHIDCAAGYKMECLNLCSKVKASGSFHGLLVNQGSLVHVHTEQGRQSFFISHEQDGYTVSNCGKRNAVFLSEQMTLMFALLYLSQCLSPGHKDEHVFLTGFGFPDFKILLIWHPPVLS